MKKLLFLSFMLLIFIVTSCSSDSDDMNNPNGDVTYSGSIKNIIDGNCLGCHTEPPVNGAPMSLVTFQNVKDAVTGRGLIGRVENGTMPPNGTLSAAQVQAIKDWQTGGFLE